MIYEDLTQIRNLKHMVDYARENFPDRDFMQYKVSSGIEAKTYKNLSDDCNAFSRMLEEKQLNDCHVAVIGPTSYNWIVSYFGTVNTGSVIVPMATAETVEMNCKLLDFADVDVLVFDAKSKPLYELAKSTLSKIKLFISIDNCSTSDDVINFSDILENFKGEYDKEPDKEKLCAIMFTSGTTGFPKGVMLTHKSLVYSATSVHVACPTTKMFCCLPINHGFCFTANITKSICRGKTVCVNDSLANLVPDLRLFKPDSIVAVPQIVKKLMGGAIKYASTKPDMSEHDAIEEFLGGNIIDIISGGAPLEASVNERFNATGILVLNGYGMTECSPIISNNALGCFRHGSVGKPIPCMDVKIVDGEILVKGPNVMLGYYKNPEATKEAFTEDGYLHTGDVGHFDDDGFLYITGRCKNLILLDNGENVSAEMLEDKFSYEPIVQEIVCFGENGAIYAEIYPNKTYIAENNITDVDGAMIDMLMRVNSTLASFQRVTAYVLRETPFERTASSKIKRGSHGAVKKQEAIPPKTAEEIKVVQAVKDLLGIKEVSMSDNFFAIGGNSLNAVELALSLNIKPQVVYDNPFLSALSLMLTKKDDESDAEIENINELIKATEDNNIIKNEYKCALLTGATGFLGIHILKELIKAGLKVYCLVRSEKKLFSQTEFYFDTLDMTNVSVISGNIESENLGLSKIQYDKLADEVDVVYHVAANVHHAGDYSDLERTNVKGTKNVIDFCLNANAVMQHTSTVSLHGAATVRQTYKNAVFDEHILNIGQYYRDNVYIHSKYRAEEAVITARTKGLKANIYRIGNLTWRASDGKFQKNYEDNGFLHRIHAMLKLGIYHDNMDKYPMDLTPVDECADAFVKLSLLRRTNEIYHMYNHNYLDSRDMFNYLGIDYRYVSTNEMIETAFANMDDRDIHVYLFYMIISGRSQNVPMLNSFTLKRLEETGFKWSIPDKHYLTVSNDDSKGLCLDYEKTEIKPMRKTGGILNPIQKLTLGVLKTADIKDGDLLQGVGAVEKLSLELEKHGLSKPLIITFNEALNIKGVASFVSVFGENASVYTSIYSEPTVKNTDEALEIYFAKKCDCVVGIGGGSVLDTAKITALRANNKDSIIDDICKLESVANVCVPLFLVPTTAGTGSEVTLFAVATDSENKKRPFISDKFLPTAVVLDPSLTYSVPKFSTAITAIDALSHAVESYISLFANAFSEDAEKALQASKLIFENIKIAYDNPNDENSRQALQNAAYISGLAFRRIGTGYIHAIAHRLGEYLHIPHGQAIALCFTKVLRAYLPFSAEKLAKMAKYCNIATEGNNDLDTANCFIDYLDKLIASFGIKNDINILTDDDKDKMVIRAQEEAKLVGSPRPFSDKELKDIINSILK